MYIVAYHTIDDEFYAQFPDMNIREVMDKNGLPDLYNEYGGPVWKIEIPFEKEVYDSLVGSTSPSVISKIADGMVCSQLWYMGLDADKTYYCFELREKLD